jgi:hypothetical protein
MLVYPQEAGGCYNFMMTENTAQWLMTDAGESLLTEASKMREERMDVTRALMRLRKSEAPEQATAAWEMADLRLRAQVKFGPNASRMFFVREALEQASSARAAAYHARRFAEAGVGTVADVCGGIGGDAIAFAQAGLHVTLYECDPVRALFADANAQALSLDGQVTVILGDIVEAKIDADAIWFDPARRDGRGRRGDPEDYQPPLSTLRRWTGKSIGVKLSPAIEHSLANAYDADLEFISDGGECKEALLWLGVLRTQHGTQATLLTNIDTLSLTVNLSFMTPIASETHGHVLYEPDAAVIRAHGIGTLAAQLQASLVAPQIAYLLSEELIPTPFAKAYKVLERFSYSRRRLQDALTRRSVGSVVIKKRGFPQEPDAVRRELKLRGTETLTVVLTRAADGPGHQVILCRPYEGN